MNTSSVYSPKDAMQKVYSSLFKHVFTEALTAPFSIRVIQK